MIDKVIDIYNQYYNQFITWYNGLEESLKYMFIIAVGFMIFLVFVLLFLSRISKR